MPGPKDIEAKTFRAWANYAIAYRHHYDARPIWNARTAGQMAQLVDRAGHDLAPFRGSMVPAHEQSVPRCQRPPRQPVLSDCETLAVQAPLHCF